MMGQGPTTTVAILGGAVVGRALMLLLRGLGYNAEFTEVYPTGPVEEPLDGVDVLLLAPGLSNDPREAFLSVMRSTLKTERIPVLALSTDPAKALAKARGDGSVVVAWPTRIEHLTREIEATLASARSSNEQGALSICGCGQRCCC